MLLELELTRRPQMIYVIGIVEMCERFAYYGTTAVCTYTPTQKS